MKVLNVERANFQKISWTVEVDDIVYTRRDIVDINDENRPLGKATYFQGNNLIAESDPVTYKINVAINLHKLDKQKK